MRVARPVPRARVIEAHGDTPEGVERALDQLYAAADRALPVPRSVRVVDLVVGENRIVTNLGRRAQGVTLSPTVADATFAWSCAIDGDTSVVITVVGSAQPSCPVEIY